jgi:hypothetical protein
LIRQLKDGKRLYAGRRIPQLASTFELGQPLRLLAQNGQEIITTGDLQPERDRLEGVPLI